MPESYIQVSPDSTGKKLRTWEETVGANTVQSQIVDFRRGPCYSIQTSGIAPAASKVFLALFNGASSGKTIRIHRCIAWNAQIAAVSGAEITIRYVRTTATSGGTAVTPIAMDTTNAAIPSQIVVQTTPTTSTEDTPAEYFLKRITTDETAGIGVAGGSPHFLVEQFNPLNPMLNSQQRVTLPEGKGVAVKQSSDSVTVGAISVIIIFELV
jgi:hypothetical protein